MSPARPSVMEGGDQINPSIAEQKELLLSTKLFIPKLRPNHVSRPRLAAKLNTYLDKTLILISAPAGYGKTTLVSSWLRESKTPSAWLSLDEGDNDPIRFLQYLLLALQKYLPTLQLDLLGLLQGMQPARFEPLLNILINEIARSAAAFILVVDDFHVIKAQPILETFTFLLEHAPPQMHMMLLSRTDPPLPLSRLRARAQLLEIRADQLRFTYQETVVFLEEVMGLRLATDDIAAMETRTEGWIAGLQLAALSMQGSKDSHSFVSAFTGSHYYIIDYLTEEVLKLQAQGLRSFLLKTSILTSMCASLCEAVVNTEGLEPVNGQVLLETLEQMNLFVIPLDDRRQWFRYHHLFADVLRLRLGDLFPEQLPELHRRASRWYEQNEMISEAIQHALSAQDQPRAVQLVEQHGCSLLMSGEGFTLLKWVEAVESYSQTHPWLAILRAWALALTGHLDQVEPILQKAEGLFSPLPTTFETKVMLGSIAAVRAYMANTYGESQSAADHAQGALEYLPDGNEFSCSIRSVATSILGDASWMNGNLESARQAYLEAVQISQAAGNRYMTMIANSNLAEVLIEQGELHQAARIYTETLQIATRPDGQKLPLADRIYAGLGEIFFEWNQLDTAGQHLRLSIELCRQWGNSNLLANGYVRLAWLERAGGNLEKAEQAIRSAERMLNEQRLSPRQADRVKFSVARWWLAQGSPERAFNLLQQSGVPDDKIKVSGEIPYLQVPEYLLLARLLVAQGDYGAALSLATRLDDIAAAAKRIDWLIEVLVLQALAWQGKKDLAQAMQVLERALSLAQPEGYTRVFLDEGEPIAKLLYQAKSYGMGRGYASELLSALGKGAEKELPSAQFLIEPLTSRELEILKLIETGWTNQEIADRLVISIPTVKRHISNIYAKLGAKSRTQAVSLGRELRLFE